MKRIFVEIDRVEEDIDTYQRIVCLHNNMSPDLEDTIFDEVFLNAGLRVNEVWTAIQEADEIYCSTALIPQYMEAMDSRTLFNSLLYKAEQAGTKGKSVYILRPKSSIRWENIKASLAEKVFKHNKLFCLDKEINIVETPLEEILELIG